MSVKRIYILCSVQQFGMCRSLAHLELPSRMNFRFCLSTANPSAISHWSGVGMRSVHLSWQHPGVLSRLRQNLTH